MTKRKPAVPSLDAPDGAQPLPPNPVPLAERLGLPAREGRSSPPAARSVSITLRLPERGLERARRIAERKGLPYQTYLKMLIHEGLERDEEALQR